VTIFSGGFRFLTKRKKWIIRFRDSANFSIQTFSKATYHKYNKYAQKLWKVVWLTEPTAVSAVHFFWQWTNVILDQYQTIISLFMALKFNFNFKIIWVNFHSWPRWFWFCLGIHYNLFLQFMVYFGVLGVETIFLCGGA